MSIRNPKCMKPSATLKQIIARTILTIMGFLAVAILSITFPLGPWIGLGVVLGIIGTIALLVWAVWNATD